MTIKGNARHHIFNRVNVKDGIHLTKIENSDAPRMANLLNDPVFYENTCSIPLPYTLADANTFISAVVEYQKQNLVQRDWAVRDRDGQLIGGIGLLYNYGLRSHRTELGFWLGKPFWNQGIMTHVLCAFTQHIFTTTEFIRLEAFVFDGNDASCRVLEKAGFIKEGHLKKAYYKESRFIDAISFAKIKF